MYACPKCGRLTSGDYLLWKGGINQAFCQNCREEEEKERREPWGIKVKQKIKLPQPKKPRT